MNWIHCAIAVFVFGIFVSHAAHLRAGEAAPGDKQTPVRFSRESGEAIESYLTRLEGYLSDDPRTEAQAFAGKFSVPMVVNELSKIVDADTRSQFEPSVGQDKRICILALRIYVAGLPAVPGSLADLNSAARIASRAFDNLVDKLKAPSTNVCIGAARSIEEIAKLFPRLAGPTKTPGMLATSESYTIGTSAFRAVKPLLNLSTHPSPDASVAGTDALGELFATVDWYLGFVDEIIRPLVDLANLGLPVPAMLKTKAESYLYSIDWKELSFGYQLLDSYAALLIHPAPKVGDAAAKALGKIVPPAVRFSRLIAKIVQLRIIDSSKLTDSDAREILRGATAAVQATHALAASIISGNSGMAGERTAALARITPALKLSIIEFIPLLQAPRERIQEMAFIELMTITKSLGEMLRDLERVPSPSPKEIREIRHAVVETKEEVFGQAIRLAESAGDVQTVRRSFVVLRQLGHPSSQTITSLAGLLSKTGSIVSRQIIFQETRDLLASHNGKNLSEEALQTVQALVRALPEQQDPVVKVTKTQIELELATLLLLQASQRQVDRMNAPDEIPKLSDVASIQDHLTQVRQSSNSAALGTILENLAKLRAAIPVRGVVDYAKVFGLIYGGLNVLVFTGLVVFARDSEHAFRLLTDPFFQKFGLYFGFAVVHFPPVRRRIFERYFASMKSRIEDRHRYVSTLCTGPSGRTTQTDELIGFLCRKERIWIQGGPGTGKSELIRETLRRYFESASLGESYAKVGRIPIYVPMRDFPGESLMGIIRDVLASHGMDFSTDDLLLRLLKTGDFVIIVDGVNEAANESDLRRFVSTHRQIRFVLTSQSAPRGWIPDFYRLEKITGDLGRALLGSFLEKRGFQQGNPLQTELPEGVESGYDIALIADLIVRNKPMPKSRLEVYGAILAACLGDISIAPLKRLAWTNVLQRRRRFEVDADFTDDYIRLLLDRVLVLRGEEQYEFGHDLMRSYLASRMVADEPSDDSRISRLQDDAVWRLDSDEQRSLFRFTCELIDHRHSLESLAQFSADMIRQRRVLLEEAQDVASKRGWKLDVRFGAAPPAGPDSSLVQTPAQREGKS